MEVVVTSILEAFGVCRSRHLVRECHVDLHRSATGPDHATTATTRGRVGFPKQHARTQRVIIKESSRSNAQKF
jgi:hypothetical protein